MPFTGFFKVKTPLEVYPLLEKFTPLGAEAIALDASLYRILAEDIVSPIDLPPFNRSTVDGYALKAKDTFGASENNPTLLNLMGEVLMGASTDLVVSEGGTVAVPTGGIIPDGADAVMMLEFSEQVDERTIQVKKSLSPLENVIQRGEDVRKGENVIPSGHRIRPQDMGAMAAFGKSRVLVHRKPKVSIVSSGDEIVDIEEEPRLGEIRDVNHYSLSALVEMAGGIPLFTGIARDTMENLRSLCKKGLQASDMLIISGGSSVGNLDYTTDVIKSLPDSEIMVHGVSLRPGKPTIIARTSTKPVVGLPGHPVSAMVVFDLFMKPIIWRLAGHVAPVWPLGKRVPAILTRNVSSPPGREDYIRVRAEEKDGEVMAHPILGKSGS
ncbi:MAG: molybdopterin molybdenumtransferase MoeA, partial [Proteobacteria bacterium]|nr:molybdopterin molybdenumtransferase MoeA [Pseudomonadota bacterium]NIS71242.1 molybdopterin molybdenumtransferase MoeA [Pseudomonadota bacterium]